MQVYVVGCFNHNISMLYLNSKFKALKPYKGQAPPWKNPPSDL